MQEQSGLNPAKRELEEALRSLAPAAARIDVVGAAFEAGRRSARRQVQLWRAAAAAALLIGVGGWLIPIRTAESNARSGAVVAVRSPSPSITPPLAAQSVLMLQAAVREHGLAGLPPTHLPDVGSGRPSDLL